MDDAILLNIEAGHVQPATRPSPGYFEHIKKVNDIFYDQIKISDQKAAYIFTFMLAFLVTSSEGRSVFTWTRYSTGTPEGIIFSGLLAISSMAAVISAIMVILPRQVSVSTSMFWGAWTKHKSDFSAAAARDDAAYLFNQYVDNADVLSQIARGKYRWVTYAFRSLMVTVLSYVLLLVSV